MIEHVARHESHRVEIAARVAPDVGAPYASLPILGELQAYLRELRRDGVPADARVRVEGGSIRVMWDPSA